MYWSDPKLSCAAVARELGCSEESVRRWVHQAGPRAVDLGSPTPAEVHASLDRIEATLAHLERRIAALVDGTSATEILALF